MTVKLEVMVKIISDDGKLEIVSNSSNEVPSFKDFDERGFASAFNSLEMAGMSSAKESLGNTMSEYLEEGSRQKSAQEGEALGLQNLRRIEDNYLVESVVGTVKTTSLGLVDGDTTAGNTASTFFAP
ncbi:MAG: hypothetical protein LBP92_15265 [Deltaproteobacteria bacterium]|jgi:hypothetical protein|nr:hypothetical protein [Deltaproteobacteria bacterium]